MFPLAGRYWAPEVLLQSSTYAMTFHFAVKWMRYIKYAVLLVVQTRILGRKDLSLNYQFPQCSSVHLSTLIPSASEEAIKPYFVALLLGSQQEAHSSRCPSAFFLPAAQRKLDMDHQEPEKSARFMKNSSRQPQYQLPARQKPELLSSAKVKVSPDVTEKPVSQKVACSDKILEVTMKLSQMRVRSGAQQKSQQRLCKPPPPPAMKTCYLVVS